MRVEAPRGTHDVLPAEQPQWDLVVRTAEELLGAYGYRRIVTPTFEETGLFARSSGEGSDIVQKEMYTFLDRSERSLTLRPEGTAPVVRAYVEHGLHREPQPLKTFMVAPMFRYAAPQKGRFREFWQLSVEAIGSDDPALDAELIQLYDVLLARLGVTGTRLELNSIGCRECRSDYLETLTAWLDQHDGSLDEEARAKRATSPLRVFDTKNPHIRALLQTAPTIDGALCDPCREHYRAVRTYLDSLDVRYELAHTLVRGLDYYSRTVWEFVHEGLEAANATICAGGRYDYLVEELGGPATPGVGFGAGIERLMPALGELPESPGIDVFFAFEDPARRPELLALMGRLRRAGTGCETDYAGRSLRGQLTQASRLGAGTVVVASARTIRLRRHGEQDVEVESVEELEALL